jgi:hypothetical protein
MNLAIMMHIYDLNQLIYRESIIEEMMMMYRLASVEISCGSTVTL